MIESFLINIETSREFSQTSTKLSVVKIYIHTHDLMNNSCVCVVWFSFIADGFAIICTKNYENGTQFYHLNSNSCKKGIAKLHVHKR